MSCWHGGHGCGPWHGVPYGPGWYDPADWYEGANWPIRRRYRRPSRLDQETAADDLEAKLDALRDEVRRVEAELVNLRGAEWGARDR
jgi:hypothetical protein